MADGENGGKTSVDVATIIGLVVGFAFVASAIILGGSPDSFINLPSILIVLGGTFAVTTICFSVGEMLGSFRLVADTVLRRSQDTEEICIAMLMIAERARKNGILSLQGRLPNLGGTDFFRNGVTMIVDGSPPEEVEAVMVREIEATAQRHDQSINILRKAAEFSPAMGLIGTLIGLVQMLGNLDDPSTIGPSMAVALLTTFYGAILSNMVFSPLAAKLERNSEDELLVSQLFLIGAVSIGRQENPRRLEMMLNSILPPGKRIKYFD